MLVCGLGTAEPPQNELQSDLLIYEIPDHFKMSNGSSAGDNSTGIPPEKLSELRQGSQLHAGFAWVPCMASPAFNCPTHFLVLATCESCSCLAIGHQ